MNLTPTYRTLKRWTHAVPVEQTTVPFLTHAGFACTLREKIAMLREARRYGYDVYAAWPGQHETHVFLVDIDAALPALAEAALAMAGM